MKRFLSFVAVFALCLSLFAVDAAFLGVWHGSFSLDGNDLKFGLTILPDGLLMDIPGQNVYSYPVPGPDTAKGDAFAATLPTGNGTVQLTGVVAGDAMTGTIVYDEKDGTFSLKRVSALDSPVSGLAVKVNGVTLHGDLLLPPDVKKPPLVVFLSGSGPTDRNGNSYAVPGRCDSIKQLAESLAANGIASYRYDKRGAASGFFLVKDESTFLFEQYIDDAKAIIAFFKSSGKYSRIIVAGHSEGALVGTVAGRLSGADGIILLAGAGIPIDYVLNRQLANAEMAEGMLAESEAVLKKLKEGKLVPDVDENLYGLFRPSVQPYLISWMKYDPALELSKVTCPVLIVQGETDLQVSTEDTDALRNEKKDAEVLLIKGMNHVLKKVSPTATEEENYAAYFSPDYPLGDGLVEAITKFVTKK